MLLHAGAVRHGLVLGIESSCDDTGVAVMTPEGHILGQALATQADVHRCIDCCLGAVLVVLESLAGAKLRPDCLCEAAGMVSSN